MCDIDVRFFLIDGDPTGNIRQKTLSALELLHTHDPRRFAYLAKHSARILVSGKGSKRGEWLGPARLVRLGEDAVADPDSSAEDIAATIVHEVAHARMGFRGIGRQPSHKQRVESVCHHEEAAFVRRLPYDPQRIEQYEEVAAWVRDSDGSFWSTDAMRARQVEDLRAYDAPGWLVRLYERRSKRT